MNKLFYLLFLFSFVFNFSICSFADQIETLDYIKSNIQARVEYNLRIGEFFENSKISEDEKRNLFFEISPDDESSNLKLQRIRDHEAFHIISLQVKKYAHDYSKILEDLDNHEDSSSYLNQSLKKDKTEIYQKLDQLSLLESPDEQKSKLSFQLIYVKLLRMLRLQERISKMSQKISQNESNYFLDLMNEHSEIPTLKYFLKILSQETGFFWSDFLKSYQFNYDFKKQKIISESDFFPTMSKVILSKFYQNFSEKSGQENKANIDLLNKTLKDPNFHPDKMYAIFTSINKNNLFPTLPQKLQISYPLFQNFFVALSDYEKNLMIYPIITKVFSTFMEIHQMESKLQEKTKIIEKLILNNEKNSDLDLLENFNTSLDTLNEFRIIELPILVHSLIYRLDMLLDRKSENEKNLKKYFVFLKRKGISFQTLIDNYKSLLFHIESEDQKKLFKSEFSKINKPLELNETNELINNQQEFNSSIEKENSNSSPSTVTSSLLEAENETTGDEFNLMDELNIFNKNLLSYPKDYNYKKYSKKNVPSLNKELNRNVWTSNLKEKFLHGKRFKRFQLFFDDDHNDLAMSFAEVKSLVTALGGKIIQSGSSHCRIIVPGGLSFSWRPHNKKGHDLKLSNTCLKGYREAFEMAGFTLDNLLKTD